jgi:hypothetical protein
VYMYFLSMLLLQEKQKYENRDLGISFVVVLYLLYKCLLHWCLCSSKFIMEACRYTRALHLYWLISFLKFQALSEPSVTYHNRQPRGSERRTIAFVANVKKLIPGEANKFS